MALTYNTNIITNNLLLNLDAANYHKSYPTENNAITPASAVITINSSSPTSSGSYVTIDTNWNLSNGQIPRYSYVFVKYDVLFNTAKDGGGASILTGNIPGTQFGPGDIPDEQVPIDLSPGSHVKLFSADGEVYTPNSAERRKMYFRTSSNIATGAVQIANVQLFYAEKFYNASNNPTSFMNFPNGIAYNTSNSGSIVFDGSDDYATSNSVLLPTSNSSPLTLEAVAMRTGSTSTWQTVLGTMGSLTQIGFSGSYFAAGRNGGSGNLFITYNSTPANIYTWYHMALSFNGSRAIAYLNGEAVASGDMGSNGGANGVSLLGTFTSNGPAESLQGRIAIARVYGEALTQTQIKQNFNAVRSRFGI